MIATHPCPYPDPRICNQPSNNTSEVAMNWILSFFGLSNLVAIWTIACVNISKLIGFIFRMHCVIV